MKMYFRLTQATSMSRRGIISRISTLGSISFTPGWSRSWNLGKVWSGTGTNGIQWSYYFWRFR
jgi:hypothetical protein